MVKITPEQNEKFLDDNDYTIRDIMRIVGCNKWSVWRWHKDGDLACMPDDEKPDDLDNYERKKLRFKGSDIKKFFSTRLIA